MKLKLTLSAAALLAISACQTSLQTTSGADYLSRYNTTHNATQSGPTTSIDDDVREIANVEPNLAFPARIGLARIDRAGLVNVPADEGYIWQETFKNLGALYGEFVPVSPLIAATVAKPKQPGASRDAAIIANIRRGAARQHLDYVLVYEVGSTRREKANALALADLTIIGMFVLPSRDIEIEASASAILLDVRTGYPYATITSHAEKSGVSSVISEYSSSIALADTAEERAVAKLAADVEAGMKDLAALSNQ
jgi:hypothetical protein